MFTFESSSGCSYILCKLLISRTLLETVMWSYLNYKVKVSINTFSEGSLHGFIWKQVIVSFLYNYFPRPFLFFLRVCHGFQATAAWHLLVLVFTVVLTASMLAVVLSLSHLFSMSPHVVRQRFATIRVADWCVLVTAGSICLFWGCYSEKNWRSQAWWSASSGPFLSLFNWLVHNTSFLSHHIWIVFLGIAFCLFKSFS